MGTTTNNSATAIPRLMKKFSAAKVKFQAAVGRTGLYGLGRVQTLSPVASASYKASHALVLNPAALPEFAENEDQSANEAIVQQRLQEGQTTMQAAIKDPTGQFIIGTNCPYAGPIENGHSTQAAGGVYATVSEDIEEFWKKQTRGIKV